MEFLPDYMDSSYFDAIHTVRDEDAFMQLRLLAKNEGLLVGSSSGAAFYGALLEAETCKRRKSYCYNFS